VREPQLVPCEVHLPQDPTSAPAHPPKTLVAQLNGKWRVIDDPLQWILQEKKGNPRKKNSGWRGRHFCRTREALLRCARGCGEIDSDALAQLQALPDYHLDWEQPK
jgi:hypothetical protein